MNIFTNARGTTSQSFTIGKRGLTLHNGIPDPAATLSVINNDLWINGSSIKTRSDGQWVNLNFDNIQLSGNTITVSNTNGDIILLPNGSGQAKVGINNIFHSGSTIPHTNISGLGSAATLSVGTITGTVASGDHTHSSASGISNGFMTSSDKIKLDSIAYGAATNQNAFSFVQAGGTTVSADWQTDTLNIESGIGLRASANATTDTITIGLGTVLVLQGGTGASTAKQPRINLGVRRMVTFTMLEAAPANNSAHNNIIFVADRNYNIVKITWIHGVRNSSASNGRITKESGTQAIGSGTLVATANAFGTNYTLQNLSLSNTSLLENERLSLSFSTNLTQFCKLCVCVELEEV